MAQEREEQYKIVLLAVTLVEQHTGAQCTHGVQTALEALAQRLVRRRLVEMAVAKWFGSSDNFFDVRVHCTTYSNAHSS